MTDQLPIICWGCAHWDGYGGCEVFPGGIPAEVGSGFSDHQEPLPGDNGQTFKLHPTNRMARRHVDNYYRWRNDPNVRMRFGDDTYVGVILPEEVPPSANQPGT